jgi:hypothetical protein
MFDWTVGANLLISRFSGNWVLVVVQACYPSYTREAEIRRIAVQGQPRQNILGDPILKIANTKRGGRVAQVVERLCNKQEAWSSSQSTTPPEIARI